MRREGCKPFHIPFRSLPAWDHPEMGPFVPELHEPDSDFDLLYQGLLLDLLDKKWSDIVLKGASPNAPRPEPLQAWYCHMRREGTEIGEDGFGAVPMLLININKMGRSGVWEKIKKGIQATGTSVQDHRGYAYVSPWHDWELVEYWEKRRYYA